jgi:hypothetical protein
MSFRTDSRAAFYALLGTFNAAQSELRQVYKARPPDFGACPCAYVGGITEPVISFDSGTYTRHLEVNLVLVDELADNEETAGRLDVLTDALFDVLQVSPHVIDGYSVTQPLRIDTAELNVGGVTYAANVIVVSAFKQDGRT